MSRGEVLKFKNYQITVKLPEEWKDFLENHVREKAYKERRNITVASLVREIIAEKYNLEIPK